MFKTATNQMNLSPKTNKRSRKNMKNPIILMQKIKIKGRSTENNIGKEPIIKVTELLQNQIINKRNNN
jgi:hypothetical protein